MLDTNILSEVMRPEPDAGVLDWLAVTPEQAIHLSVVTLGEIERGLLKLGTTRRAHDLRARFNTMLRPTLSVLDINREIMVIWARLCTAAETQGRPSDGVNALIAATCVQHGLTLVTRSTRDFGAFGVPLLNPWSA